MKLSIKGYFFPWAGGTSRIYSSLTQQVEDLLKKSRDGDSAFALDSEAIDYPGRFARPSDGGPILTDVKSLASFLVDELFSAKEDQQQQPFVLFGHSLGAIVAFEIAKLLQERNMQNPLALFVSAARPPSSQSLTSSGEGNTKLVSQMDLAEITDYFRARGSTMQFSLEGEVQELFLQGLHADYKALETYVPNHGTVSCPLIAIGGDSDVIVSEKETLAWKSHQDGGSFDSHILEGKGHFYLNDDGGLASIQDLAKLFVQHIQELLDDRVHEGDLDLVVRELYAKVLSVDLEVVTLNSDFFELGGSSLDTIALVSLIKSTVGIHITQNEFFLNPKVHELSLRLSAIKASTSSLAAPSELVPIQGSVDGNKWFHAAPPQEQMISCWEMAPKMYNMPTTIEFAGEAAVDVDKLTAAFRFVVQQQPVLRTIVSAEGQHFMQKVLPASMAEDCFELKVVEVKNEDEARITIEAESVYVFPLYDPPIFRGVLVRILNGPTYLLLNQHHVGSDGWTLTVIRRQLLRAYLSICTDGQADKSLLIPDHPNFVDWTCWLRTWLLDYGMQEKQLNYWKNKLEDLPVLDLPTDKPRPAVLSSRGMSIPIVLDPSLIRQFNDLVASKGANLYAGLLALYMTVLHRMGGGDDFAVGIALANRNHEGLHDLVGYFANEVAVRGQFETDMSFPELLGSVRGNILEGMANSDVPYHKVVEALRVPKDSSRTPVFQAMFALQERDWHTLDDVRSSHGNTPFKLKYFAHNTSKFEVHLMLRHDGNGGIAGDLHIATDLFTAESGRRLVQIYEKLMRCCVQLPEASIASHDATPQSDKQLIKATNNTAKKYDESRSIMDWDSDLQGIAFVADGSEPTHTTYAEFKVMVSSVTSYLVKAGAKRQSRVGVLVKTTVASLAAIFGIVGAGCTIVVLDPEKTPVDRCRVIFNDSDVKIVLVNDEFEDSFQALREIGARDLVSLGPVLNTATDSTIAPQKGNPDDIFGIFYTSGTTGTPKGAIISHGNVLNLSNWWREFFQLQGSDRVLLFSSLSFIMSLRQYIPTLCAGATVVLPSSSMEFESAIMKGQVNKLICTPSALAALDVNRIAHGIDAVQVAGEAPRAATMKTWKQRVKNLYIGLGPTELCAHALCGEFDGETVCIGFPARNVRAYIVGKSGLQAPVNVRGELWVAGENVAMGYLNRTELTKKHFGMDPFNAESSSRIYRTGDMAQRLPDGRIQFLGRADKQLKVNGFRIEAVNGQLQLFVAPEVDTENIKSTLQKKLPRYMVPMRVFAVAEFPLNKNRKLDADALLLHVRSRAASRRRSSLSSFPSRSLRIEDGSQMLEETSQMFEGLGDELSRIEESIRLIWSQLLGVDPNDIASCSNFFEKGGTSLSAVMVSRALSSEFQMKVPVHELFMHQTVRALAEFISISSDVVQYAGDPRPVLFLPGGRQALHPFMFATLQGFGLIFVSIIAFLPLTATILISLRSFLFFGAIGAALIPALLTCGFMLHLLLVILCKWIIIGRYKQGKAKMFSWYFLKWWLVRRLLQVTRLYTWSFDDTALSGVFFRLLGASVGRHGSMEQPYLLEPDLVDIGDDCVLEYEVQIATSEVRNGLLVLRQVFVGNNVKLGTRAVLLGGAYIHDDCEVAPKSTVDFSSSTAKPRQVVVGSPAKIEDGKATDGFLWRPRRGFAYTMFQLFGCFLILALLTCILCFGASIGWIISKKGGLIAFIIYLGSLFPYLCGLLLIGIVTLLNCVLIPRIIPGKVYEGSWFAWRKWFLDRLFLSPWFSFSCQRSLESSSLFPWYLRLLGAKMGKKVWLTHPSLRVGSGLINIGDGVHIGMQSYMSTERHWKGGVSFHPISIGKNSSCGQRTIVLGGVSVGSFATVGAETLLPYDFALEDGGTSFGSPPLAFKTATKFEDIVDQAQIAAKAMASDALDTSNTDFSGSEHVSKVENEQRSSRLRSRSVYWLYVPTMIVVQMFLPLVIVLSYASIGYIAKAVLGEFRWEYLPAIVPIVYVLGSVVLVVILKILQLFGGSYAIGTTAYYSLRFLYWFFFTELTYLVTSTIFTPFAGTELYCMWLRFMGSKIGKRVFISPENGGFRELDFLDIGDNCCVLTPNINSHYADHGMMQFCPVRLENGCEINQGATIMPLTKYEEKCRLNPFAVTVKGQVCAKGTEYVGNPCTALKADSSQKCAILFGGLGSQYPGMLDNLLNLPRATKLLEDASGNLGIDFRALCDASADPMKLHDSRVAQSIVTVMNLMSAELMRQKEAVDFSKANVCAGFSVGELSALCFARAISFEDTLRLASVASETVAACKGGAMCNVTGLPLEKVERLCSRFGCSIANVICDHRGHDCAANNVFVCGGSVAEIDALVSHVNGQIDLERNEGVGAKKLRVTAAHHTQRLKQAQVEFGKVLKTVKITFPRNHLVYSNITGRPYRSVEEIRQLLPLQMIMPVQWHATITDMHQHEGIEKFIECGAMGTLSKMIKRILPDISDEQLVASNSK